MVTVGVKDTGSPPVDFGAYRARLGTIVSGRVPQFHELDTEGYELLEGRAAARRAEESKDAHIMPAARHSPRKGGNDRFEPAEWCGSNEMAHP